MASPAHRKISVLGFWFWILLLQKQQLLAPAELGTESWVQLPFTRCQSFQPCMSSRAAMCLFTRSAGSNSVDRLLCCASHFHKMFLMLSMRRMEIYNQEKSTLVYSVYLEISTIFSPTAISPNSQLIYCSDLFQKAPQNSPRFYLLSM